MPAKNVVKEYLPDSYYHLYNRGVEKRIIFNQAQDYKTFLSYLKIYLSPQPELPKEISDTFRATVKKLQLNNYHREVTLISYCLMPNHFHLIIKQKSETAITNFMHSLCTKYTMYFNKKYQRVGKLYQGPYKAVLVKSEAQLLHLSRYIHLNPIASKQLTSKQVHQQLIDNYSSYPDYLRLRNTAWVKPGQVLQFFNSTKLSSSYKNFVESHYSSTSDETISKLLLE